MAAGFIVQAMLYTISNEVIEAVLSTRMEVSQKKISTLAAMKSIGTLKKGQTGGLHRAMTAIAQVGRVKSNQKNSKEDDVLSTEQGGTTPTSDRAEKPSNLTNDGIGGEAILALGTKSLDGRYKWSRHRAEVFEARKMSFLAWVVYMIADCVLRILLARQDAAGGG